jgi:hypothetical protein
MTDDTYTREDTGRFAVGNRGGVGHANARLTAEYQKAIKETITPARFKLILASLLKAVIDNQDVAAARLLMDRTLGKPRSESAQPLAMELPDGLASPREIAVAAHALLRAMAAGEISPEDAQRGAMVVEAARRAVETEELAQRVADLEKRATRNIE